MLDAASWIVDDYCTCARYARCVAEGAIVKLIECRTPGCKFEPAGWLGVSKSECEAWITRALDCKTGLPS